MNPAPFARGSAFGPFEIVEPLGAGGMGEVYRARDTRLGREVALKILLPEVRLDAQRIARFDREARLLAGLSHPNIAALHGIESAGGVQALVLELVEGRTLAERLEEGPVPLREAIDIALQIVAALEAAHARGIVHRDLKPANVKLRPDGTIKVLDFGLAKILDRAGGTDAGAATVTALGPPDAILGTPRYMSPEQARGLPVDQRADIWAFGCVLFEMLTGAPPFAGERASEVVAKVLEREVDFDALPRATPAALRRLLRRCLAKDAARRLRDIGDARLDLDEPAEDTAAQPRGIRHRRHRTALLAIAALMALGLAGWAYGVRVAPRAAPAQVVRFTLDVAAERQSTAERALAVSPDGSRFAYLLDEGLFVRARDRLDARFLRRLPSMTAAAPFFSPNGEWVGYTDGQALMRVPSAGGAPVRIAAVGPAAMGSWAGDQIVFADLRGLFRIGAGGGEAERLLATGSGEQFTWPQLLPGGRAVLFTTVPTRSHKPSALSEAVNAHVDVLDLATGERRTLIRGGGRGIYVPTGHVVFDADGHLHAVPFDPKTLRTRGSAAAVGPAGRVADLAISAEGTLLYQPAFPAPEGKLVWVDRQGREEALPAPPRQYIYPRLSPDGRRIALDMVVAGDRDIWLWDIERQTLTRFTVDPTDNSLVAWTPDGRSLVFNSHRTGVGNLYLQEVNGSGEARRLLASEELQQPIGFAPDGRLLFAADVPGQDRDIRALALDGSRPVESILQGPANQINATVSPDGRFVAYESDESGQFEIYVRPWPDTDGGGRWQVTSGGGRQPMWSRDGRELYYRDFDGAFIAVPVRLAPTFSAGLASKLFAHPAYAGSGSTASGITYDLSQDGRRFLVIKRESLDRQSLPRLTVVLNWFEELERLVPANAD